MYIYIYIYIIITYNKHITDYNNTITAASSTNQNRRQSTCRTSLFTTGYLNAEVQLYGT